MCTKLHSSVVIPLTTTPVFCFPFFPTTTSASTTTPTKLPHLLTYYCIYFLYHIHSNPQTLQHSPTCFLVSIYSWVSVHTFPSPSPMFQRTTANITCEETDKHTDISTLVKLGQTYKDWFISSYLNWIHTLYRHSSRLNKTKVSFMPASSPLILIHRFSKLNRLHLWFHS